MISPDTTPSQRQRDAARVAWRSGVSYDQRALGAALDAVLADLGGLQSYVRPGDRVLLNPNLLSARGPDRAVTTHPAVTMAIADRVRALGAQVWIGDSPAGAVKGLRRVWERTGYLQAARDHGHELVGFEAAGGQVETVDGYRFLLNRWLLSADVVISVPKLKTHVLTLYTGGVKKVFGQIPGLAKAEFHKRHPHPADFAGMLAALYGRVRPQLTILDGIVGMEGRGPASGCPRPLGWLLAGSDAVAVDALGSWLIGLEPARVDTTRLAACAGLGEADLRRIAVLGPDPSAHRRGDVELPDDRWLRRVPRPLARAAASLVSVRLQVDPRLCTACGACVQMCPTAAIHQTESTARIDSQGCALCLGCREVCEDDAVRLYPSPLARLLL